jgi:hypothetical protein
MQKYQVYARCLHTGQTVPEPSGTVYDNFIDAREVGRQFVLSKQDETGSGWAWHLEEVTD